MMGNISHCLLIYNFSVFLSIKKVLIFPRKWKTQKLLQTFFSDNQQALQHVTQNTRAHIEQHSADKSFDVVCLPCFTVVVKFMGFWTTVIISKWVDAGRKLSTQSIYLSKKHNAKYIITGAIKIYVLLPLTPSRHDDDYCLLPARTFVNREKRCWCMFM